MKSLDEIHEFLVKNENTFTNKLTRWGSEYIQVNGIKFRLSDHESKHEYQNHIDINNYSEIIPYLRSINRLNEPVISRAEFIDLYLSGGKYEDHLINTSQQMVDGILTEMFSNDFVGKYFTLEDAAYSLYSKLFVNRF